VQFRACPLCGADEGDVLLAPEAAEFCSTNWTYRADFRTLLGLPEEVRFPIRRCRACSLAYAAVVPSDAFLTTLYEEVIVHASCIEGSENRLSQAGRLRCVADLLELAPEGRARALDYGSGAGVTLRLFAACGVDAVGFEPSRIRVSYCIEAGSQVENDVDALRSHAPFSMVVLDNVLEHIAEPVQTMKLLHAITTPEAVAYVSVPSYETDTMRKQIERHGRGQALDMTLNPWEHLSYFSRGTLDRLMAVGGFRPIPAMEYRRPPDIGLRAQTSRLARIKNVTASAVRALRYAITGEAVVNVTSRYYRRA
jgi:hypothetical protein